jgi:hypothetical protein
MIAALEGTSLEEAARRARESPPGGADFAGAYI